MTKDPKIRLYVQAALSAGGGVALGPGQSHYLHTVMCCRAGDEVLLFNGVDGEWGVRVAAISKRNCDLELIKQVRPQAAGPDLLLCFAPIKKTPLEFLVRCATELGVTSFQPMLTAHTDVKKVNSERLVAIAVEAAEQCGRLEVPELADITPLDSLLESWPDDRAIMFCDEAGDARPVLAALGDKTPLRPWAIMIGPVGGFSAAERARIRAHPSAVPVSLGSKILKADTAALVAVALWQAVLGDGGRDH